MDNSYAELMRHQGYHVISVKDVHWYNYQGFMVPAYLPHCCPAISEDIARKALAESGCLFARWDCDFGKIKESQWWYILRRGKWSIDDVKEREERRRIRKGRENFKVRFLTTDEVINLCPDVAMTAAMRYKGQTDVETRAILEKRARSAEKIPGVLEYIGCFAGDKLAGFSENIIQQNAVWLTNIRHDPAFLSKHSSYRLIDAILEHYLNEKKMDYVLNGCRNIHHRTGFQDYLMKAFGFTKEYALLNVAYSQRFKLAVRAAYPFRKLFWFFTDRWQNNTTDKIYAILKQEYIRRSCHALSKSACPADVKTEKSEKTDGGIVSPGF